MLSSTVIQNWLYQELDGERVGHGVGHHSCDHLLLVGMNSSHLIPNMAVFVLDP